MNVKLNYCIQRLVQLSLDINVIPLRVKTLSPTSAQAGRSGQ